MSHSLRPFGRSRQRGSFFEPLEARTMLAIELLKDISPSTNPIVPPGVMTDVNGTVYFFAIYNLWKSDGTQAGTQKVSSDFFYHPISITNVNGSLFWNEFGAMWKSDGTSAGTVRVKPSVAMDPRSITPVGSVAYFCGTDGGGEELWVTDGTDAGTHRVKDINAGATGSDPREFINVNGRLYFRARDAAGGDELWTTDGTDAGTVRVKDINPGTGNSEPVSLTNVNGTLFFVAHDADDSGYELWKSDGTDAGTVRVKDIRPGKPGSSPTSLRNVNGTLMFVATDGASGYELWKSDGSEAGTTIIKDLIPGGGSPGIDQATVVGNALFFTADDGNGAGAELWKTDGTAAGTGLVKDMIPGGAGASPGGLTAMGANLYFIANDYQIWKSDGTAAGTAPLGGPARSSSAKLTPAAGGKLFFVGDDGFGATLWVTDGTAAGTAARNVTFNYGASSNPGPVVRVGNLLYFTASDPINGLEIWKSDGTEAGTSLLADLYPGWGSIYPSELTDFNGTLVFVAGGKLWKSDGTAAGTAPVSNTGMSPSKLKVVGSRLYFLGYDGGGQELWKSDGTEAGTGRVADIRPGGAASGIDAITDVNGAIYFVADDGVHGQEIWKSDGTAGGTVLVKDIIAGADSSGPLLLTNVNGTLYFRASDGAAGWELWKSNGTAGGTQMVKDIRAGAGSAVIHAITAVGNNAFFIADDGVHGQEVWKSDGTAAGTTLMLDIKAGPQGSSPTNLTELNGKVVFRADDGVSGAELWTSDGTPAGTQILKDIRPGAAGSEPAKFANVEGKLVFFANDLPKLRIWVSDGTAAGTYGIPDFSDDGYFNTVAGMNGVLYFSGNNFVSGTEPRRLVIPAAPPPVTAGAAAASAPPAESSAPAPISQPSGAAFADGDIFYDTLGGAYRPVSVASAGLSPALLFGSGFYTDGTYSAIDESLVRGLARQAVSLNRPLVLDIEQWPVDLSRFSEAVVQANLEKLTQVMDWAHDERPNVKVGLYGVVPPDIYPAPPPGTGSWHAATEHVRSLIDKVDELHVGLYTVNPMQGKTWRTGAENMIAEARLYGKPVRPFIWPQYFYNPEQVGRFAAPDMWRMELDTMHDLADGAILWGAKPVWDDDAPWWTVTRDFLIDPAPIAPAAPGALAAPTKTAQRVDLQWTDNAYNETGWRVERRLGGGPFVFVATLGTNAKAYSDSSVSAASGYTYRVVAFNAGGDSLASNDLAVTTPTANVPPGTPVNPGAAGVTPALIRVSWLPGSANQSGFKIERATGAGAFAQIGTAAAGATSYDDVTAVLGTNYQYRVRAYNAFGDSAYSAHVAGVSVVSSKDVRGIWKLDDAAGASAIDSSGAGNAGSLANGPAWTSGTLGGALSFDGMDDRVVVADSPTLRFAAGDDFMLSAWVNLAPLPGHRIGVVTRAGDGILIDATNHWVFGNIVGPEAATGWSHVAAVQSGAGGTRKLYINGVEVASGAAASFNAAGDLWIGGTASASEYFAGKIDDVRVYGKAWTAAEVATLASPHMTLSGGSGNDAFVIDIDPLTDYYRFVANNVTVSTALRDAVASIEVNGNAGNDQLTVDFAGGEAMPDYGFNFAGGADKDTLKIAGNRPIAPFAADATHITHGSNSVTHSGVEALTLAAATLTVNANLGIDLRLEAGGAAAIGAAQKLTALTLAGGSVDVVNQHVAINYTGPTPMADITAAIQAGRNAGQWNGNGIVTSLQAAKKPTQLTTLVPVEASSFLNIAPTGTSTWFGQTVDGTTVLLVYAWAGDTNFDGFLDGDDYAAIDSGFSAQPGGYVNGDFDFNGVIDADDYFILDSNYGRAGGALPSPPAPTGASEIFSVNPSPFANMPVESAYDRVLGEASEDILV